MAAKGTTKLVTNCPDLEFPRGGLNNHFWIEAREPRRQAVLDPKYRETGNPSSGEL